MESGGLWWTRASQLQNKILLSNKEVYLCRDPFTDGVRRSSAANRALLGSTAAANGEDLGLICCLF